MSPRIRQAPLEFWDRGPARCDSLVVPLRLIVEADGRRWHTREADFERDRDRDNLAQAYGYDTLRLTYHRLTRRRAWTLGLLRTYVKTRSAELGL